VVSFDKYNKACCELARWSCYIAGQIWQTAVGFQHGIGSSTLLSIYIWVLGDESVSVCVCVFVCAREREMERERGGEKVTEREEVWVSVCVYLCERVRERMIEREGVCVCVCVYVWERVGK